MLKIGLIINPIAGLGGPAGLKGSDGAASQIAFTKGFQPKAEERVIEVLKPLGSLLNQVEFYTCSDAMGERALCRVGVKYEVAYSSLNVPTLSEDTKNAVKVLKDKSVDVLLFAGGDGTARDLCEVIGDKVLVIGIPSGVKMHSGVFAVTPHAATELITLLIKNALVGTMISQVRDLDEDELRAGQVSSRFYGEMLTPVEGRYLQHVKCGGKESEELVHQEVAAYMIENMIDGRRYVLGSGSTTMAIKEALGIDGTLLGIDVVENGELILKDADEHELNSLPDDKPTTLIVTLIGGQGHVFGRGNQQLSSRVLEKIGLSNILIVATKEKIKSLEGRPLLCDTDSSETNRKLCGLKTVITGYEDTVVYPLMNP